MKKKKIELKIEIEGGVVQNVVFVNPKDYEKYDLEYILEDKD